MGEQLILSIASAKMKDGRSGTVVGYCSICLAAAARPKAGPVDSRLAFAKSVRLTQATMMLIYSFSVCTLFLVSS